MEQTIGIYSKKQRDVKNMSDILEKKKELRKEIKKKAAELPEDYCKKADEAIFKKVISMPEYVNAEVIFCYVGTKREIYTNPILDHILKSGKRLGIPKCLSYGVMEVYEIENFSQLVKGAYEIMEPAWECRVILPEEIDLAIVPCLTCTPDGKRLGYGGGFYDRYLPKLKCPKIVLCRKRLMVKDIPTDDHDVTFDVVIFDE